MSPLDQNPEKDDGAEQVRRRAVMNSIQSDLRRAKQMEDDALNDQAPLPEATARLVLEQAHELRQKALEYLRDEFPKIWEVIYNRPVPDGPGLTEYDLKAEIGHIVSFPSVDTSDGEQP